MRPIEMGDRREAADCSHRRRFDGPWMPCGTLIHISARVHFAPTTVHPMPRLRTVAAQAHTSVVDVNREKKPVIIR